jgi:signal transduction histidine kinase
MLLEPHHHKTLSTLVTLFLIGALVLLIDPFMYWMPEGYVFWVLLLAAVLAGVWVGLVSFELPRDEREVVQTHMAARAAYISGVVMLTAALIYQGYYMMFNPWIPATLIVMLVVKLFARLYADRNL